MVARGLFSLVILPADRLRTADEFPVVASLLRKITKPAEYQEKRPLLAGNIDVERSCHFIDSLTRLL